MRLHYVGWAIRSAGSSSSHHLCISRLRLRRHRIPYGWDCGHGLRRGDRGFLRPHVVRRRSAFSDRRMFRRRCGNGTVVNRLGNDFDDFDVVVTAGVSEEVEGGTDLSVVEDVVYAEATVEGVVVVLCVVVVTMWAYFTGLSSKPAAISPAGCAMSTINIAPTLSAISRIRA